MKHIYVDVNDVTHEWETVDLVASLDTIGVLATLLAVTGMLTVKDAANAVGLSEQDLVNEAQAWAAAANR